MPTDVAIATDEDDVDHLPVDPARLDDLRRARRHRRVAEIHWVDALYRVYVAAIVGLVVVIAVAGSVGDEPLNAAQVADVKAHGPALIGLLASVAVAIGLRSGSRGGPLAVEPGDVRHVLLAPVDRGRALRSPAWRQVRSGLFAAVLLGATIGRFADRRFPDQNPVEWILAGAAAMVLVVGLSLGTALVASGRRLPRPAATAIGLLLLAWSALDVAGVDLGGSSLPASPGRAVGWLALAPLDLHLVSIVPIVVAIALLAVGMAGVGGLSIESAEQRTALVGQIRFAATLQDVRTVLVLRRQLAADRPRDRPWLQLRSSRILRPIGLRAWHGILRFPATRVARLVLIAGIVGAALRGTWSGTAPLVLVAGLAAWLLGLDLVEPMAQEVDHPSRRELYRHPEGALYVSLLLPSFVVAALLGLVAGGIAILPGAGQIPVGPALASGVSVALAGVAGAILNVVSGQPSHKSDLALMAPEVAGMGMVLKSVLPLLVAVAGALPLLVVEANDNAGRDLLQGASTAWAAVLTVVGLVLAWVHQREEISRWWREAQEAQSASSRRDDEDEDEDDDEDEEDD
ncbi:MAG TPA: hypothetical protein VGO78_17595 [Acidimicrobiales bacterium]|nr:hypothetical protein [Acidimicrobiales bacterium]